MIGPLFQSQREVLNWAGGFIALCLVGILAFLCWALVTRVIPPENENIMFAVVGVVATQVTQITGFFFGSSQQAKKQADTIEHLSKAAVPSAPTIDVPPGGSVTAHTEIKAEGGDTQ